VAGPGGKPVSSSTQTCSLIARRTPASTQTRRPTPSRSGWACTRLLAPRDCSCRVPSAEVRRADPLHRFERHPGLRVPPNSTLLGFRLRLAEDGTYFKVARP
jgi:hypothetical protein